ncbi:MAG: hypothetical protein GXY53_11545 [Desulfobulbus sp.]|nr:hypothetical protein [Desulfobulbus sp.]
MNTPAFENLDLACAKAGKTIAKKPSKELENIVTDALAVLEEQGLYALFLYLEKAVSGTEKKKMAEKISLELNEFLKKTPQQFPLLPDNTEIFASFQQIANNLDNLLLARDLVRQTLVYARYHARVPQKSEVSA